MPSATEAPDDVKLLNIWRVFDGEMETLREFDATLLFPVESVNVFAATETEPVPPVGPVAVNVMVRVVPDVVSADNLPRVAEKSARTRSATSSLSVTVMVHVAPAA